MRRARTILQVAKWLWIAAIIPAQAAPQLELGATSGAPGSTALLPLSVQGSSDIVAVQFELRYDASKVTGQAPGLGADLDGFTLASATVSPGVQRLILYSRSGTALPATTQLNVPFLVSGHAAVGTAAVTLANVILADSGAKSVPPAGLVPGSISIVASAGASFQTVQLTRDGVLNFPFTGEAGRTYVLQTSPDLRAWLPWSTNIAVGSTVNLTDRASARQLFYRAFVVP